MYYALFFIILTLCFLVPMCMEAVVGCFVVVNEGFFLCMCWSCSWHFVSANAAVLRFTSLHVIKVNLLP